MELYMLSLNVFALKLLYSYYMISKFIDFLFFSTSLSSLIFHVLSSWVNNFSYVSVQTHNLITCSVELTYYIFNDLSAVIKHVR